MSDSERDYEAEAREDGWVPKESWQGPPERWIDAKTFVENGEKILPIVNAKLRKALVDINELREGNRRFREYHEAALEKERREREQAVAQLEAERKRAISEGDGDAFDKADKKLREINRAPPPQRSDPELDAWLKENSWYTTDRQLAAIADGLSDVVKGENPHLRGRAFLDKLTEVVKAEVPHKFSQGRRENPTTEDNRNTPPSKREKGYDDLPDDAKAACEKFVRTIPGFTREQYLKDYVWSQQ